jgi:hypothetical protein
MLHNRVKIALHVVCENKLELETLEVLKNLQLYAYAFNGFNSRCLLASETYFRNSLTQNIWFPEQSDPKLLISGMVLPKTFDFRKGVTQNIWFPEQSYPKNLTSGTVLPKTFDIRKSLTQNIWFTEQSYPKYLISRTVLPKTFDFRKSLKTFDIRNSLTQNIWFLEQSYPKHLISRTVLPKTFDFGNSLTQILWFPETSHLNTHKTAILMHIIKHTKTVGLWGIAFALEMEQLMLEHR